MNETSNSGNEAAEAVPPDAPARSSTHRTAMYLVFGIALFVGLLFEAIIVGAVKRILPDPNANREILYWQSPMDPSIRSDKPGKTAMGMDLVPVYADVEPSNGPVMIRPEIEESEHAIVTVERGPLVRSLESVSTVTFAEPLIGDVTLKMEGWLEELHVDYEGQTVKKGDALFDVYAPALFAAEEEFLTSLAYLKNPATSRTRFAEENVKSARQKLRYLDMTDKQIDELARKGVVQKTLTFYSPISGIVIEKKAFEGKSIPAGQLLYRIADLSKVWVNVSIYENQIHCVYKGQGATLTLSELPGRTFSGKVVYVYPYLDPKSRTVKVRLEFDNPNLLLMPDMFGRVKLEPHRMGQGLRIPQTAVMQTGMRNLVYVALPENRFEDREVRTGMELDGDLLEVLGGLKAGERIVASPNFLMDSESRIRLMNRKFAAPPMPTPGEAHQHKMPGMDMPGHSMKTKESESMRDMRQDSSKQ
ncbi:Cation efflux system protein CusB precursor [Bremerella volcania]|uniref:Cation efflux system protein CusB n=1 Tax=Bremerella volcania TaxID=2527984 RepID=A0A518C5P0_9BACT|nr:efflux RND transporter periplasmic adaptor subunit [Bremerella volcania]QDU74546.1 Cation efflux system protein CusB precursor [Bremerella volcania]